MFISKDRVVPHSLLSGWGPWQAAGLEKSCGLRNICRARQGGGPGCSSTCFLNNIYGKFERQAKHPSLWGHRKGDLASQLQSVALEGGICRGLYLVCVAPTVKRSLLTARRKVSRRQSSRRVTNVGRWLLEKISVPPVVGVDMNSLSFGNMGWMRCGPHQWIFRFHIGAHLGKSCKSSVGCASGFWPEKDQRSYHISHLRFTARFMTHGQYHLGCPPVHVKVCLVGYPYKPSFVTTAKKGDIIIITVIKEDPSIPSFLQVASLIKGSEGLYLKESLHVGILAPKMVLAEPQMLSSWSHICLRLGEMPFATQKQGLLKWCGIGQRGRPFGDFHNWRSMATFSCFWRFMWLWANWASWLKVFLLGFF